MKKYFLVTSYGRTATYWLASFLDRHPDIICSHGPLAVTDSQFMAPQRQQVIRAHNNWDNFNNTTVEQFFDEIEKRGEAKIYGNVHGYTLRGLISRYTKEKIRRKIWVSNLIRHPVTRVESLKNEWCQEISYSPRMRQFLSEYWQTNLKWCQEISYNPELHQSLSKSWQTDLETVQRELRDVDFDASDNWIFVVALYWAIGHDVNELQMDCVDHIQMERLTSDAELLLHLTNEITQGTLDIKHSLIDEMINSDRYNATSNSKMFPMSVFDSWEQWKRALFGLAMDQYEAREIYDPVGYDMSFIG